MIPITQGSIISRIYNGKNISFTFFTIFLNSYRLGGISELKQEKDDCNHYSLLDSFKCLWSIFYYHQITSNATNFMVFWKAADMRSQIALKWKLNDLSQFIKVDWFYFARFFRVMIWCVLVVWTHFFINKTHNCPDSVTNPIIEWFFS